MKNRLRLADPVPTAPDEGRLLAPRYFDMEVRMFQVEISLASKGGLFPSMAFPGPRPSLDPAWIPSETEEDASAVPV